MPDDIEQKINQWIRPVIRQLSAYHVPDPGNMIKLDAMENPYGWPEDLKREWLSLLHDAPLNRYPDPGARELSGHLRDTMGIPDTAGVILGNGSDEIIQMILLALAHPEHVVLAPAPTFVMYHMITKFCGMHYVSVPLKDDFQLDSVAMLTAIEAHRPAVVFLAYPNNPTGNLFDEETIIKIIEASPGLVVVDEAYAPFSDATFMDLLGSFDNLLVMRTVSKQGLAGLRLGLLAGAVEWINEIDKLRLPYNINVLTQLSAGFALQHMDMLDEQAQRIKDDRQTLIQQLAQLPGISVYPSAANFILLRTAAGKASDLFCQLKGRGVLIKNLDSDGALKDCLRVTIGTTEENQLFLQAFRQALEK